MYLWTKPFHQKTKSNLLDLKNNHQKKKKIHAFHPSNQGAEASSRLALSTEGVLGYPALMRSIT